MKRLGSWLCIAVAFAVAGALVASCTVDLTEGCVSGPCIIPDSDAATACTAQTGDFPCDVFAVLHGPKDTKTGLYTGKCNLCHQDPPQNGAPFSLLTYADTQPLLGATMCRWQVMEDLIQPTPTLGPHMPDQLATTPPPPELTPAEFKTLDDWLKGGAVPVAAGTGCGCPGKGCD